MDPLLDLFDISPDLVFEQIGVVMIMSNSPVSNPGWKDLVLDILNKTIGYADTIVCMGVSIASDVAKEFANANNWKIGIYEGDIVENIKVFNLINETGIRATLEFSQDNGVEILAYSLHIFSIFTNIVAYPAIEQGSIQGDIDIEESNVDSDSSEDNWREKKRKKLYKRKRELILEEVNINENISNAKRRRITFASGPIAVLNMDNEFYPLSSDILSVIFMYMDLPTISKARGISKAFYYAYLNTKFYFVLPSSYSDYPIWAMYFTQYIISSGFDDKDNLCGKIHRYYYMWKTRDYQTGRATEKPITVLCDQICLYYRDRVKISLLFRDMELWSGANIKCLSISVGDVMKDYFTAYTHYGSSILLIPVKSRTRLSIIYKTMKGKTYPSIKTLIISKGKTYLSINTLIEFFPSLNEIVFTGKMTEKDKEGIDGLIPWRYMSDASSLYC